MRASDPVGGCMKVDLTPFTALTNLQTPEKTNQAAKEAFARSARQSGLAESAGTIAPGEPVDKEAETVRKDIQDASRAPVVKHTERADSRPEKHTEARTPAVEGNEASAPGKPADGAPMSRFLSEDEKEMLARLFPPPGREFGIRAYRQGQKPLPKEPIRGSRVDLST